MQVSRSMPRPANAVGTALTTGAANAANAASAGQRTAMSFDVDERKHAMTVSVVDRNSGEVLQKMVYDKRVAAQPSSPSPLQPSTRARAGRAGALVDVTA